MSHFNSLVVIYIGRIFMEGIIEATKLNNGDKGKPAKRLGRKAMDLKSILDYDSQVTDLIGVQV
jgi:hypothetical protein